MESSGPSPAARMEEGRQRLRLAFAADQCADLLPLLDAAAGAEVAGMYRVQGLLAAGSQFLVWLAADRASGRPVILKQARFDYRHPVRYGRAEADALRRAARREHDVLLADRSGTLPRPLGLIVTGPVVPAAAAAPALARDELFVVEEYVGGLTLSDLALRVWPSRPAADREAAAARLARGFVEFWEALRAAGWHYGDLSSDNLLVEPSGKLRVVDGGSAVPAGDTVVLTGFTPAFTTPNLYARAKGVGPSRRTSRPCCRCSARCCTSR